jgi:hypothetical protein
MALMLAAVVLLIAVLAVTGRLGLSMTDLMDPESEDREWMSEPDDCSIDFREALRPYSSARRGE